MAAALPFIAIGIQAVGAIGQANAARAAGEYNAAVARTNATIAQQQAGEEQASLRRAGKRALGGIRAGYGASGVRMEGTPLDVLTASAAESELDVLRAGYAGELRAMGFETQARAAELAGKTGQQSAQLQGASNLLLSGAKAYDSGAITKRGTPVRAA